MRVILLRSVAILGLLAASLPAGAQDADYRITQMEEQMRQLTGQVQNLQFEIEKLKRALADDEFRLQQLESGGKAPVAAVTAPAPAPAPAPSPVPAPAPAPALTQAPAAPVAQAGSLEKAPGPQVLGTLAAPGGQATAGQGGNDLLPAPVEATGLDGQPVSLASPTTPDALYQQSYESLLRGKFADAQQGFADFGQRYPQHELAGNARYWLGEAYYGAGDFKTAAQTFLDGYKTFPTSPKAPDTLLKLGMSLGKLGQKQQSCTVLQSVPVRFPQAAEAVKRAKTEAKRAGCS